MPRGRVMSTTVALIVLLIVALTSCSGSEKGVTAGPDKVAAPESVPDELPVALDNGAEGRNTYNSPNHVPPKTACGEKVQKSKRSLVVRVLPEGPRAADGSLAFTSGVCVYIPPGYQESGLRYPVVYLLHGGGGDAGDAVAMGMLRDLMDEAIAHDADAAAIVVMPDGTNGQWYDSVDGRVRNELYVMRSVVPYIDGHFRTIANRRGRAIAGVSNGGFGAMLLAGKHPDQFVAAGGMSSNLDGLTMFGLGPFEGAHYRANHPVELAKHYARTDVILDIASRCMDPDPAALCGTQTVDQAFLAANRAFVEAVRGQGGRRAVVDYEEVDGAHQWYSWTEQLRDRQLPFLLERLSDPVRAN